MKSTPHAWQRLVAAAQRAPEEPVGSAPFGFSTRVVALAFASERPAGSLFERLSLRAMGVACALALLAVAANYSSISRLFDDETPPTDDPVAALVDIAS